MTQPDLFRLYLQVKAFNMQSRGAQNLTDWMFYNCIEMAIDPAYIRYNPLDDNNLIQDLNEEISFYIDNIDECGSLEDIYYHVIKFQVLLDDKGIKREWNIVGPIQ